MSETDYAFKIAMVGSFAVGKTSLVRRHVEGIFDEKYQSTIGVKVDRKVMEHGERKITLVLWDLAGEDRFHRLETSYLRGAAGYLLVADGTRPNTLEVAEELDRRAQEALPGRPRRLLVNKLDLKDRWATPWEELEKKASAIAPLHVTSAKTGEGVEEAFGDLTDDVLDALG
ncbi:MAG: Rab family GTPase [Acidobacteriota bacterium]